MSSHVLVLALRLLVSKAWELSSSSVSRESSFCDAVWFLLWHCAGSSFLRIVLNVSFGRQSVVGVSLVLAG